MAEHADLSSKINKCASDLDKYRTIPPSYEKTLTARLVELFTLVEPLIPLESGLPLSRSEQKQQSYTKRVRISYLRVLEEAPLIFLPFLLVVPPSLCRLLNLDEFLHQHNEAHREWTAIRLGPSAWEYFRKVSGEHGFGNDARYSSFQKILFPIDYTPRPSCATDAPARHHFPRVNVAGTRAYFGDGIVDATELAPPRPGDARRDASETEFACIDVSYTLADTVFTFEIGEADEIVRILFPRIAFRLLDDGMRPQADDGQLEDNALFSIPGASVLGIASLFPRSTVNAIETSELRQWEKERCLIDYTDCVTMVMSRAKPHIGTLKVRVGHEDGSVMVGAMCVKGY